MEETFADILLILLILGTTFSVITSLFYWDDKIKKSYEEEQEVEEDMKRWRR